MTSTAATREGAQVFEVSIRATPQAIWDAITSPEWNGRYGYGSATTYDLRPGGRAETRASHAMKEYGGPDVIIDGEVLESEPPRKLVQTWRALWDAEIAAEGGTRLTWEIGEGPSGICTLTVTHDVTRAPKTRAMVTGETKESGGGWPMILADLKRLLETGASSVTEQQPKG